LSGVVGGTSSWVVCGNEFPSVELGVGVDILKLQAVGGENGEVLAERKVSTKGGPEKGLGVKVNLIVFLSLYLDQIRHHRANVGIVCAYCKLAISLDAEESVDPISRA
jgi:hypothetical protein